MDLRIIAPSLPDGYCYPASPQTLANDLAAQMVAQFPDEIQGYVISNSTPDATDQDKIWFRTDGFGAPMTPFPWVFYNGQWVSKHPIPASDKRIVLFYGSSAEIDSLDAGSAGIVSVNTGPFWEIYTAIAARSPIGVGTLPSGAVIGVGTAGGAEDHTLSLAQLPSHNFKVQSIGNNCTVVGDNTRFGGKPYTDEADFAAIDSPVTETKGGDEAHNNMHPYLGLYFIHRTARVLCTSPIA